MQANGRPWESNGHTESTHSTLESQFTGIISVCYGIFALNECTSPLDPHALSPEHKAFFSRLLKNAHLLRFQPAHLLAGVPRVAPYPSQRHPSFFPVSSTGRASCGVHPGYAFRAGSPTRRRGKKSLLIRRDATLRISGAPVNGISKTQLASACLREVPPCGTKAGPFLSSLRNNHFFSNLLEME